GRVPLGGDGAGVEEGLPAVGRGVVPVSAEVLVVEDDRAAVARQVGVVDVQAVGDDPHLDAGAVGQVVRRGAGVTGLVLDVHGLQGLGLQERHIWVRRADGLAAGAGRGGRRARVARGAGVG